MQKINIILILLGSPPKCNTVHYTEDRVRPNAYEAATPGLNIRFLRFSGKHNLESSLHVLSQVIQDLEWKWISIENKMCVFDFDAFIQELQSYRGQTPEVQQLEWMKGKVRVEPVIEHETDKRNSTKQNTVLALTITEADVSKNPYKHLEMQCSAVDLLPALVVLECEETLQQGTGFFLQGVGLVTCAHVIGFHTQLIHPRTGNKYPVTLVSQHKTIDLAVLKLTDAQTDLGFQMLRQATSDHVDVGFPVALAGFPNYRPGDSGIFKEGKVVGFRTVSSIRRLLIDASIVAGNSGGPVVNHRGEVIGVAVTGADREETVEQTEDHGVIPIEALDIMQQDIAV